MNLEFSFPLIHRLNSFKSFFNISCWITFFTLTLNLGFDTGEITFHASYWWLLPIFLYVCFNILFNIYMGRLEDQVESRFTNFIGGNLTIGSTWTWTLKNWSVVYGGYTTSILGRKTHLFTSNTNSQELALELTPLEVVEGLRASV